MVYYCCCCYVSCYYYGIMIQGSPQDPDPHFNPLQLLVFVEHIPRVFACVLPPGHIHPAITLSPCRINEGTCPQDLEPSHPLQIQAHSVPQAPVSPVAPSGTSPDPTLPSSPPDSSPACHPALISTEGGEGGDMCPGRPSCARPSLCISTFTLRWLSPLTHQLVNRLRSHVSSWWRLIRQSI